MCQPNFDTIFDPVLPEPNRIFGLLNLSNITHLCIHRTTRRADGLIDIGVQYNDHAEVRIKWLPDSGSDVDAITLTDLNKIDPDLIWNLARDTQKVSAANGTSLGQRGTVNVLLNLQGIACHTTLHVFSRLNTSLLSKNTCIKLSLLKEGWPSSHVLTQKTDHDRVQKISVDRVLDKPVSHTPHAFDGNQRLESTLGFRKTDSDEALPPDFSDTEAIKAKLMEEFSEVFQDEPFRPMAGPAMHIDLVDGAIPCRHFKARTIPFKWRESVHQQLKKMEEKNIIEKVPVSESITWCHPMVVLPKKNSDEPRITVDLTGLNKFVKRPVHPTRVPREAVAAIPPGMKVYNIRLQTWVLANPIRRAEFETHHLFDPMGCIPVSTKCYGSIVSW